MANPQFKFEKQVLSNKEYEFLSVSPEQVIMLDIQNNMKTAGYRSFKSYLKYHETTRIQRTGISLKEIAKLLNITIYDAEYLAVQWMNEIGGTVVQHADLNCYYFKETYDIVN